MPDFTKLAEYLDSFSKDSQDYDLVSFIKQKIAQDLQDPGTVNNGAEQELEDNDITTATSENRSSENTEGEMMHGAFQEFEALNQIDDEKDKVVLEEPKTFNGSPKDFGDNAMNQREKNASFFDALQARLRK
jgi:hypothetical protein